MTSSIVAIVLTIVAPRLDAAADLKAKCLEAGAAKSYAFSATIDSDAPLPGGGKVDAAPIAGKVEVGAVSEWKQGDVLGYRKGEKVVHRKKDAWEPFTPPSGGGGRGGKYGGGGGGGGDVKEQAALRVFATTPLPHELLAGLHLKVKDVKVAESDGKRTFSGALLESAALTLSGADQLRGPPPAKGGGAAAKAPEVKASGSATLVVGKDGAVEKLVLDMHVKSAQGEFKEKYVYSLHDWGATKVDVPKEAASKLEG